MTPEQAAYTILRTLYGSHTKALAEIKRQWGTNNEGGNELESTQSLINQLDQADEGEATWWNPEAGDVVAGLITKKIQKEGDHGPYILYFLQTEQGEEIGVSAMRTVLKNELSNKDAQIGDKVAIRYEGTGETKKGVEFHNYTVRVSKPF